jgi:hypothetical protein
MFLYFTGTVCRTILGSVSFAILKHWACQSFPYYHESFPILPGNFGSFNIYKEGRKTFPGVVRAMFHASKIPLEQYTLCFPEKVWRVYVYLRPRTYSISHTKMLFEKVYKCLMSHCCTVCSADDQKIKRNLMRWQNVLICCNHTFPISRIRPSIIVKFYFLSLKECRII